MTKLQILKVGLPVALQSVLLSAMGLIDTLMISPLGDVALASVGAGARWLTFISMLLFCLATCGQILLSHLAGAKDWDGFKRMAHTGSLHVVYAAILIGLLFIFFPNSLISVISSSSIIAGSAVVFFQILGGVIFLTGISVAIDAVLRSVGKTQESLYVYILEILINIILNYVFLYGMEGMGVLGVGLSSLIARAVRTIVLVYILYKLQGIFLFSAESGMDSFNVSRIKKFYIFAWPLLMSSLAWSSGVFCMHSIIGHMGESELAAMSFFAPFEMIALSFIAGVCCGSSILIGQSLGKDDYTTAQVLAKNSLQLSILVGAFAAAVFFVTMYVFLGSQSFLDSDVVKVVIGILPFAIISIIARTITSTQIHGILKAGGDTKFCMYLDVICQWGIAIPVVFTAALIFKWELTLVYMLIQIEELLKIIPGFLRIRKNKWLNNLAVEKKPEFA